MDITAIDVKDFGHLLEPEASRQDLQEGLRRALAAAATEMNSIEKALDNDFRLGRGRHHTNDDRWKFLKAKAEWLDVLSYTAGQLLAKAIWEADFGGLRPFDVTDDDAKRLRNAMVDAEELVIQATATLRI